MLLKIFSYGSNHTISNIPKRNPPHGHWTNFMRISQKNKGKIFLQITAFLTLSDKLQSWSYYFETFDTLSIFLPSVKWSVIITNKNGTYKFPHKLPNNLRLKKLGNILKISTHHAIIA